MVAQSGGRIALRIDGKTYPVRGEVKQENVGGIENEVASNSDGSSYKTTKAVPVFYDIKLSYRAGLTAEILLEANDINFSAEMIDMGEVHIVSGASLHGKIDHNHSNGEMDGFKLAGGVVRKVRK